MHPRYYGATLALLTLPAIGLAQATATLPAPTWPDGAALVKEGVALHDKQQYGEAIARYERVTPGDSSYALAQSELALSLLANKKYEAALAAVQRSLAKEPFDVQALNVQASAQEELKQVDAARQTYARALKLFPYNEPLWADRGILEYNQGQPAAALEYLQRALVLRPAHATPHRLLGLLAARQNQPAHALISLLMCLGIEPESERSQGVLVLVEQLASGQPVVEEKDKLAALSPNGDFEELDQLLTSKIALNKDYRSKVKFNAALVKQTQLLVEKFPVDADPSRDFWVRTYAPLVQVLRQEDNLTTFTYLILLSASDNSARQWVKANKSRVEKLTAALAAPLLALRQQQPLPDGKLAAAWFDGPVLAGLGAGTRAADGHITPTGGPWLLIGKTGEIQERGSFAGPAKRGGLWQTLRPDGSVEKEETYASTGPSLGELDGPQRFFYPSGRLQVESMYRAGKLEGVSKSFAASGKVTETRPFVHNDYEGEVVSFFPDGTPSFRTPMHADKKEGKVTRYYPNGTLEAQYTFAADQLQGPYESYYVNKVLEKKATYENGELNGPYLRNYPNGQPQQTGAYTKGKYSGQWREYFANGKLSVEKSYDEAGKLHGVYRDYDLQGRPWADMYYEHGRVVRLVHLDEAGKTRVDVTLKKGRQPVKVYDLEGRTRGTGYMENGQLAGEWRRFYADGILREVAHYDPATGNQVGTHETYYRSGQLRERRNHNAAGDLDGYFEQFYLDGQLQQTGFYRAGQPQGVWKSYAANGRLTQERELNGGELNGPMREYEAGGKLVNEWTYDYGKLRRVVSYDSTGRETERQEIPATAPELVRHFPGASAKTLNRAGLADGDYEGPTTWYHANGQPEVSATLRGGKRYGLYRSYYPNGRLWQEVEYLNGERYGPSSTYYPDGTLLKRGRYLADEPVGEWTYNFPNGKPGKTRTFDDEGNLHGVCRDYNPAGELLLEQRFENGLLVSYLAPGAAAGAAPQAAPLAGGPVQVAFANGKPAVSGSYEHGYPGASFVYYYSSGQVFRRVAYQKGLLSGSLVSYWPNGKLMEEENYLHDELHGRCRYYRPDGTLEREETYCAGERRGPTTYYSAQGKPSHKEVYWNNSPYGSK